MSIAKKIGVCIVGFVVLCAACAGIYMHTLLSKLDIEEVEEEEVLVNEEVAVKGYTNIALFGIDTREGELDMGSRSDCLIIASLNNETKEIRLASVYRDTLLDIKDGNLQKCNAAYSYGGPTQAINMLNKNLDLDIQEYVTVDFTAVANAIDLLGGIEIEVKEEEVDALNWIVYETAKVAEKEVTFVESAGVNLLDGVQATSYARIRSTAGGDFTRAERQRLVIEKMVEKAQQSDLMTINKIVNEVFPTIKTSFTITEILSYVKDFAKYQLSDSTGFPFDKTTDTIGNLGSIVIPVTLESNVKLLHEFLYGDIDYVPSAEVTDISSKIIYRVGQREATGDKLPDPQEQLPNEDTEQEIVPDEEQIPDDEGGEMPPEDSPEDIPEGDGAETEDVPALPENNVIAGEDDEETAKKEY